MARMMMIDVKMNTKELVRVIEMHKRMFRLIPRKHRIEREALRKQVKRLLASTLKGMKVRRVKGKA